MDNTQYKNDYKKYVVPFAEGKLRITVDENTIASITDLANSIIKAKASEYHHKIDNGQEFKRFYTGLLGEAAMEKLLGIDIIDYSVGKSNYYNIADLSKQGLNIGVKTVELWKFPVIHKHVVRPEIINVRRDDTTIVCFGYAPISALKKYQNDNYILSPLLRMRGTKTCFWGFNELIPFNSLDELIKIHQKHSN
ncbi:hypothetical protein IJ579_05325 [bacterium]|nr:hypothetical protein [bacterium]